MNIHYDQKDGLGSVPDNQNVDYKGFKAWMVPDMFLKLARRIYIDPQDTSYLFLKNAIKRGKPIGSPFLNVNWDESNSQRRYPLHEGVDPWDTAHSFRIPDDFIVDLIWPVQPDPSIDPTLFHVLTISIFGNGIVV